MLTVISANICAPTVFGHRGKGSVYTVLFAAFRDVGFRAN